MRVEALGQGGVQRARAALRKADDEDGARADDDEDHVTEHNTNVQPASCAVVVDLPLAQKGPAAVARYLIEEARCTEEQISAIAGLARDWQNAWDARTNKESHLFTGLCVI